MNIELVKMYLKEIEDIASTSRIGKVLVSPNRALDEIVFIAKDAEKCIGED